VLAAFGYVQAAAALIYPAIISLGLITLLFILQRLIGDAWAMIMKTDEKGRDALVPVLAGFAMTLASLPVFALIWGARSSDITELWTRFTGASNWAIPASRHQLHGLRGGLCHRLHADTAGPGGPAQHDPAKTSMDQGGQTALVAGIGYVGIFLAALVAVRSAGLTCRASPSSPVRCPSVSVSACRTSSRISSRASSFWSNAPSAKVTGSRSARAGPRAVHLGPLHPDRDLRPQRCHRPQRRPCHGAVTNWTRFNLSGRLIVPVAVAQGTDSRKVERILREIAEPSPLPS